jgi:hypothetical protein
VAGSRGTPWALVVALALLVAAGAAVAVVALGDDEAEAQTVRFEQPEESGDDPFTAPADRPGRRRVRVGSGPFGGTGSDLVCDRELLISSLRARPDRLREWARVLGVEPTATAVSRYIRRLRPVTLTRDTRVTNHSFVDGRAVAYQAILQAGTAVLVDKDGKPVARCRCGNPLLEPVFVKEARCDGCPADYEPPPPCDYYDYDDAQYERFDDEDYEREYEASQFEGTCYMPYPEPPAVRFRRERSPPAEPAQEEPPAATVPNEAEPAPEEPAPQETSPEPQPEEPKSDYPCPEQPPAHPGEDYLRNCPPE